MGMTNRDGAVISNANLVPMRSRSDYCNSGKTLATCARSLAFKDKLNCEGDHELVLYAAKIGIHVGGARRTKTAKRESE